MQLLYSSGYVQLTRIPKPAISGVQPVATVISSLFKENHAFLIARASIFIFKLTLPRTIYSFQELSQADFILHIAILPASKFALRVRLSLQKPHDCKPLL